jgi:DNA-directed RNA polymerase subunit M/transcription elongation factor TFIIS
MAEGKYGQRESEMDQVATPGRTCPACGSTDYVFRGRKKIADGKDTAVETKYRCRACGHEWKVQVAT